MTSITRKKKSKKYSIQRYQANLSAITLYTILYFAVFEIILPALYKEALDVMILIAFKRFILLSTIVLLIIITCKFAYTRLLKRLIEVEKEKIRANEVTDPFKESHWSPDEQKKIDDLIAEEARIAKNNRNISYTICLSIIIIIFTILLIKSF